MEEKAKAISEANMKKSQSHLDDTENLHKGEIRSKE